MDFGSSITTYVNLFSLLFLYPNLMLSYSSQTHCSQKPINSLTKASLSIISSHKAPSVLNRLNRCSVCQESMWTPSVLIQQRCPSSRAPDNIILLYWTTQMWVLSSGLMWKWVALSFSQDFFAIQTACPESGDWNVDCVHQFTPYKQLKSAEGNYQTSSCDL